MIKTIKSILSEITEKEWDISEDTQISDSWGSLVQMELVIALEQTYNTKFSINQITSMKTVRDIMEAVRENTQNR